MQAQVLKIKYWIDGYAICNFEDKYYWLVMPISSYFYYNDNTLKTADMLPVSDTGTLETISFFIEIAPQLNALGLQPVSCTFKSDVKVEITHIIIMHLSSREYFKVPVTKLNMLTANLIHDSTKSSITSPIHLFCEDIR